MVVILLMSASKVHVIEKLHCLVSNCLMSGLCCMSPGLSFVDLPSAGPQPWRTNLWSEQSIAPQARDLIRAAATQRDNL